jgi:hypothetical protein
MNDEPIKFASRLSESDYIQFGIGRLFGNKNFVLLVSINSIMIFVYFREIKQPIWLSVTVILILLLMWMYVYMKPVIKSLKTDKRLFENVNWEINQQSVTRFGETFTIASELESFIKVDETKNYFIMQRDEKTYVVMPKLNIPGADIRLIRNYFRNNIAENLLRLKSA